MNADERKYLDELSNTVIGAAYEVSNVLGSGFFEKVYENALAAELRLRGLAVQAQQAVPVHYKSELVGHYFADVLVADRLIVELKCCDVFADEHIAQCLNYLKATNLHLALLLNFQRPKVEIKRIVLNF